MLNNAGAINIDAFSLTITGNGGTSTNTGTISVGTSTTLNLQVAAITNAGTLQVNGGGGADGCLSINSNTLTLNGGGTVNLTAAFGGGNASITGNGYTLTNVDNTIQGTGVVGSGGTLINGGTVNANSSAGIGTLTLPNPLTNSNGSTGGLLEAAGATNNSSMVVHVDTSSAGSVNGAIAINYTTNGTVNGVSNGLGSVSAGSSSFGVVGTIAANVVDQANPLINNPTINLGNVRIHNTSPTAFVSVTNQATGNPQAALNASITGNAPITASGSFNLLSPGSTNNSSLQVGMNTSAAGHIAGTATVAFVSDASNIGNCSPNCQINLPSQNVNVSGNVYRLANPQQNTSALTLAGRVGGVGDTSHLTGAVSITNTSPDAFTEGLNVTRGTLTSTPAGGFTGSGSVTNLAAQATSSAIQVSLNTGTSGTFTGSQALNFVSTGAGTTGAPDLGVGTGSVTLNGHVYTAAVAQVNTAQPINLGIVHVGDVAPQANVSVTNAAGDALNDSLLMSFTSASSGFTGSGNLGATGLAAGQTNATGLHVTMNTGTAGSFGGSVIFGASSHDSELADFGLDAVNVGVMGQVNNFAQSAFVFGSGAGSFTHTGSTYTLDFGTQVQGSGVLLSSLFAGNGALGPADLLNETFQFLDPLDFGETGFNPFFDLAAQQFTAGPLGLAFDTSNLGTFTDTIALHGIGHNASGFSAAVGDITLLVEGNVVRRSVPEPGTLGLAALALAILASRARQESGRSPVIRH